MDAIRLQNLRSLNDTGTIKLAPLTLLVGKNGSGKSTFARFFMLLRQSIESRTKGPILWYGDNGVDYGSFEESLNKHSSSETIIFSFTIPISVKQSRRSPYISPWEPNIINDCIANIECTINCTKEKKTFLQNLNITINDDNITITMDKNAKITKYTVNDLDILTTGGNYESAEKAHFFPYIRPSSIYHNENRRHHFFPYAIRDAILVDSIATDIKEHFCHGKVKAENIRNIVSVLPYGDKEAFLAHLKSLKDLGSLYSQNITHATIEDALIKQIRSKVLASMTTSILMYLDDFISGFAANIRYIEPVRAGIARYYREQDLSVDEIDPLGKNLPMFLRSLSDTDKKDFSIWTRETLGFEVKAHSKHGQIALHLTEEGCTQDYNLADMGFGFSQILPIVAQLWILVRRKKDRHEVRVTTPQILSIEQPELHLHPNHQAKVADMFAAAIRLGKKADIDLRLIIETHSETIINRIGNLIYKEILSEEDANVILFEKPHADRSAKVSVSSYDSDGLLQNWPFGFFQPEEG